MRSLLRSLVASIGRIWRLTVGAVIPDSCRFTPSCSHYAAEAIQRKGILVGSALSLWRLLKCQPLHPGGYDPVIRSKPPCLPTQHTQPRSTAES